MNLIEITQGASMPGAFIWQNMVLVDDGHASCQVIIQKSQINVIGEQGLLYTDPSSKCSIVINYEVLEVQATEMSLLAMMRGSICPMWSQTGQLSDCSGCMQH